MRAVVQRIREIVREGVLGDVLFVDSVRINLGLVQPDVDVLWDLAPHDLSILDYILPEGFLPLAVAAHGADPMVELENDKPTVMALREIAEGLVDTSILDEDLRKQESVEDVFEISEARMQEVVDELSQALPAAAASSDSTVESPETPAE